MFGSLIASMLLSVQATAATPVIEADLQCLAILSVAAGSASSEEQSGIVAGAMYFMGRIDARQPGYDLDANMVRLLSRSDVAAMFVDQRTRCGAILEDRGAYLQSVGKSLQEKARTAK